MAPPRPDPLADAMRTMGLTGEERARVAALLSAHHHDIAPLSGAADPQARVAALGRLHAQLRAEVGSAKAGQLIVALMSASTSAQSSPRTALGGGSNFARVSSKRAESPR
jgi:hypothetical protein